MNRYKLACVSVDPGQSVDLQISDPELLGWLLGKLREVFPECRISYEEWISTLPSGDMFSCTISELHRRELAAAWWMMKLLCERGWEPFSSDSVVLQDGSLGRHYCLRFRWSQE